jgi:hypothetical protein
VVKERQNADDGEYKGADDESRLAKRARLVRECIRPSAVDSDSDGPV